MRVCLFEDLHVRDLEPLTLTRPAFELLCGQTALADKQWRHFNTSSPAVLVRPHLADLQRVRRPAVPVNDTDWFKAGPAVLVNARWLPPAVVADDLNTPCVGMVGEEVAYTVVGPERLADCFPSRATSEVLETSEVGVLPIGDCLESWQNVLPRREAGGRLVRYLWELVDLNGEQIARDHQQRVARSLRERNPARGASGLLLAHQEERDVPEGLALVGPRDRLVIDRGARVEPMVLADTTGGPVVIDRGAVVTAFTRLEGPCHVGPDTQVLGARIRAGTSLGPRCRVGGEIEASIVLGHSNKYHEGFLGHSYVGEWVNLGAGTHNSDLRNDYGEVAVTVNGRRVPTGRTKVGCFLGDHARTGLGALLNTGTSAGVFSNLLPWGLLPKTVPSFTAVWKGTLVENADLLGLLDTATKTMARRGAALTEAHAELYRGLLARTAGERQRTIREAEQRLLRRGA